MSHRIMVAAAIALAYAGSAHTEPTSATLTGTTPSAEGAESPSPAYADGRRDRQVWEDWFNALSPGPYRDGTLWWASVRSNRNPGSCASASSDPQWGTGCSAARERLTNPDTRRKAEPAYRLGWNSEIAASSTIDPAHAIRGSPQPEIAPSATEAPSEGGSSRTSEQAGDQQLASADPPWFFVSTILHECTPVRDVFPKPGDHFPSTPASIIAEVAEGRYRASRPSYGPAGHQHPPGPVVVLTDLLGFYSTVALVQGEQACQDVLAILLKAGAEGSAEQRWAARNAARVQQWHVVYWAGRETCTPLSEFVPGATTPDEALELIQLADLDAHIDKLNEPNQWERIIRTLGRNLRMVRGEMYCRIWHSLVYGGGQ
jgi:hypothetical protein